MKFYTSCERFKNNILVRGYENGERFQKSERYSPFLFISSNNPNSEYRNLKYKRFEKKHFDTMGNASSFIKDYENVDGFDVYGITQYNYLWIYENFPGEIEYDPEVISIGSLDIETKKGQGAYAKAETAEKPITLITVRKNGHAHTFGYKDYKSDKKDRTFYKCRDEKDMLSRFLRFWKSPECDLDIVTGWNIIGYDLPYIHNRLKLILGESLANSLSPWEIVNDKEKTDKTGFTRKEKEIIGIAALDYLDLYKKFSFTPQESYKLEDVANYELDSGKLNYSEYASLDELEEKDYNKFVNYNIIDTELVDRMEEKLQFISMCISNAYFCKCNFIDNMGTVRLWDMRIHSYLMNKNVCVPPKNFSFKDEQFAGGFVKEVKNGMYKWIVTYDVSGMHPALFMGYNISPEMIREYYPDVSIESLLDQSCDILDDLKDKNLCITANGFSYDRSDTGIIPEIIGMVIAEKDKANGLMIEAQKELLLIEEEMKKRGLKTREDKF